MQAQVELVLKGKKDDELLVAKHKKALDERFDIEIKKQKDIWAAGEKRRMQKWEEQKLLEIRDKTEKGLEPELQRIIQKSKDDVRRIKEECADDLRK